MPRRGLFKQAKAIGLFQSLSKEGRRHSKPLPPLPTTTAPVSGAGERENIMPLATAESQRTQPEGPDIHEVAHLLVPGAHPGLERDQIPEIVPEVQREQEQLDLGQMLSQQTRRSRIDRLRDFILPPEAAVVLTDVQAPPSQPMSWNEVRRFLDIPGPAPAGYPIPEAQGWDRIRCSLGLPLANQWQNGLPQIPQAPMGPQQPILFQTPNGPIYLPGPPPAAQPGPMMGAPTDTPWKQWDPKQVAMIFLLAGMKLTWNAATSMWEIITMAWDQSVKDEMKMRDQYNQQMQVLAQLGYQIPVQQPPQNPTMPYGLPLQALPQPPPQVPPQLLQAQVPGSWVW
ncbi:hypothetical protein H072_2425 [Dactylellina haptotyla CBS 200.50]|uniref:Uncharacterized protein n=1 Tax=Dactylellina haptotyla (strain CBS 200.50) TaxID=1284197 RepID=S8AL46_DACHA|nr:hypothetical protein H072_2425 [Dactylellina haptotyla CBS 200.50]